MLNRQLGTVLLAGAFLAAGLAWIVMFWGVWPRASNTSPLMALFAGVCACAYVATAVLTWRRSRLAAPALMVAIGLLLFPARFLVPGGQISLLASVVIISVAATGYWYLRRTRESPLRNDGPLRRHSRHVSRIRSQR